VRGFARFVPYADPRITLLSADSPATKLNVEQFDNRGIGLLGAAVVHTKSWVPAGYMVCYAAGDDDKPLCWREHPSTALRGLRVANRLDDYPLYADQMEAYFGHARRQRCCITPVVLWPTFRQSFKGGA
jgi:hypothetical protein